MHMIKDNLQHGIKQLHEKQEKTEKEILKQRKVTNIQTCFNKINTKVEDFANITHS